MFYLALFLIISNLHAFTANHNPAQSAVTGVIKFLEEAQNCESSQIWVGPWNNSDLIYGLILNSIQTQFNPHFIPSFLWSYSDISRYSSNLCSISIYLSPDYALSGSAIFSRTKLSLSIAKRTAHLVLCEETSCTWISKHFTRSDSILPELFGRHLFISSDTHFWRMHPANKELVSVQDLSWDRTNFEGKRLIFGSSGGRGSQKGKDTPRRQR